MNQYQGVFDGNSDDWQRSVKLIDETMREMSLQTDPQAMVRAYGRRVRELMPADGWLSLSRRDLEAPWYRITRSSRWSEEINPWKERERLPLLQGGLLGELIYGDGPRLIDDVRFAPDDAAAEYLEGMRSLIAVPHYDEGVGRNMVVSMRKQPAAFSREKFPEWVWISNLFGRATQNLMLSERVKDAYAMVDKELKVVADIQRSLLPKALPRFPTLDLAAHYQTSHWAGGDYYDVFPMGEGRCGILIADVSGHGTPAAVLMAITHSIVHAHPGDPEPPGRLLTHINRHLCERYTADGETFVTAFYGIYDAYRRVIRYACAGHNPPRLMRCATGEITSLDGVQRLPLGIDAEVRYDEHVQDLQPGDQILFYTDGITEAEAPDGSQFGMDRLDRVLTQCTLNAANLIQSVLDAVDEHTAGLPAADDRTLLVAKVS